MEKLLKNLRRAGWRVAVHEDFVLGGVELTSWLFIHESGVYVKGEGKTDTDALRLVNTQARPALMLSLARVLKANKKGK